jgi:hypothetical protein
MFLKAAIVSNVVKKFRPLCVTGRVGLFCAGVHEHPYFLQQGPYR